MSLRENHKAVLARDHVGAQYRGRPLWFLFDFLALMAIFLQVTELYRPLGYIANFPSSQSVNVAFLAFFTVYLAINFSALMRVMSFRVVMWWVGALFILPIAIMMVQVLLGFVDAERFFYWTMFSLIFTEILVVSIILWGRFGKGFSVYFFIACIVAAWAGFVVNAFNYAFLRQVLEFSANRIAVSDSTVRIMGFYSHPNMAAYSICISFACLACDPEFLRKGFLFRSLVLSLCLLGVLITGSRTSLILFFIVFFWYLKGLKLLQPIRSFRSKGLRLAVMPMLFGLFFISTLFILKVTANSGSELSMTVMARLESLVHLLDTDSVESDASISLRLSILGQYASAIAENPFFGYGPDYAFDQVSSGNFSNVSQNSWIEWALKFGIVYPVFVGLAMLATLNLRAVRRPISATIISRIKLILLLYVVAMLSLVDIFWLRSSVCALGSLLGLFIFREWGASPASGEGRRVLHVGVTR